MSNDGKSLTKKQEQALGESTRQMLGQRQPSREKEETAYRCRVDTSRFESALQELERLELAPELFEDFLATFSDGWPVEFVADPTEGAGEPLVWVTFNLPERFGERLAALKASKA